MEENLTNKRFSVAFLIGACMMSLLIGRWSATKGSNLEGIT